eukprot:scaffold5286_cov224-Pinguiococcus_pyrenoidosus.AAC.5
MALPRMSTYSTIKEKMHNWKTLKNSPLLFRPRISCCARTEVPQTSTTEQNAKKKKKSPRRSATLQR